MDFERLVAGHLTKQTGITAVLEVPAKRPQEFMSVELASARMGPYLTVASLTVQSWAITRQRARQIAELVEGSIGELIKVPQVFSAEATNTYRWADPDSGQARYQTNIELIVCE